MHRRDFLQARPPPPAAEVPLLRVARSAMATTFEVLLPFGTPNALAIAGSALDEVHRLEDQLTIYHDHSEVSRINRLAAEAPQLVEERLFALLLRAAEIHRDSDGAFDIACGALVRAWGFHRRRGQVPSPADLQAARDRSGMAHVVLEPQRRTVRFTRPGVEINLGSIGKGHALDRAGERLRLSHGIASAVLHGGSSSVLALGGPDAIHGWPLGIRHPWQPGRRLAVVTLRDRAIGTSAGTFQHFEYNGRKLGHLLDPRTGWPAEGIASATAIAPTAADADALATAFYIGGEVMARTYCTDHPDVGAILLSDGADEPLVINLAPGIVDLSPTEIDHHPPSDDP